MCPCVDLKEPIYLLSSDELKTYDHRACDSHFENGRHLENFENAELLL
jgi:hypothetical protein